MTYLALAIACSLTIGVILKHAGLRHLDRMQMLTVNYVVAVLLGLGLMTVRGDEVLSALTSRGLVALALGTGLVLIGGFFVFALAVQRAGMSVSIAVTRIGVAIPFVYSWMVFGEPATAAQWTGLVLVGFALVLITRPRKKKKGIEMGATGLTALAACLLLLWVTGGAVDVLLKTFDEVYGNALSIDAFISLSFAVSAAVGGLVLWKRPESGTDRRAVGWGVMLGIVNYGSILFILAALRHLPGTVVFPTQAVCVVVGGALLGVAIWKEHLSPLNLSGVALAAAAVALLNG